MGSEELLEFEAWGLRLVGRCEPVGVVLPPWGEELPAELFLFEPTRFLNRAFMEFIGKEEEGKREYDEWGACQDELRLIRRPATRLKARQQQKRRRRSRSRSRSRSPSGIGYWRRLLCLLCSVAAV